MILTSIEKLANDIGFDIGNSDDKVQADLINGFARGIFNSMDEQDRNTQICYIVDKLDKKGMDLITLMNAFVKLKDA